MNSLDAFSRPYRLIALLLLAVILLYAGSLSAPFVFDDQNLFEYTAILSTYGHSYFNFDTRWFSYAPLGWTVNWLGLDIFWLRFGNVLLHAANVIALFFLLRRIFEVTLAGDDKSAAINTNLTWFAFFGALLFALHPVAVYGVAYLIQRSILMATLFVLLMLLAYLHGILRNSWRWMLVAALCYFAAVYSKEHSIMAPGVALALTFLIRKPSVQLLKLVTPFFVLAAISTVSVLLSAKGVLGDIYEPRAWAMLGQAAKAEGVTDLSNVHLLSILTQAWLFFKYLGLWLIPNPAWMSVDMREPFAMSLTAWPYTLGMVMFLAYPCLAVWLLFKRGSWGLLGFALLFPWILFLTEGSVVRIQEPFVLYRSYLWMPGLCVALPAVFGWLAPKRAFILLAAISLLLIPLTLNRLQSFSSPLMLWDDAEKLVRDRPDVIGTGRIYYYFGIALLDLNRYDEAIINLNKAIATGSDYINDSYVKRGMVYYYQRKYPEALHDLNFAIAYKSDNPQPYYIRALTHRAMGDYAAAQEDFEKSCALGGLCS